MALVKHCHGNKMSRVGSVGGSRWVLGGLRWICDALRWLLDTKMLVSLTRKGRVGVLTYAMAQHEWFHAAVEYRLRFMVRCLIFIFHYQ